MTDEAPQIRFLHRSEPQQAEVRWDPESFVLSALIGTGMVRLEPLSIADQMNRHLGIAPDAPRIVIGDLDILLDAKGHIRTVEIRTNPQLWTRRRLRALPEDLEPVWAEFSATYDENRIAIYSLPVEIIVDGQHISLSFGSGTAERWGALASNVVLGTTDNGHLRELRFTDTRLRLP